MLKYSSGFPSTQQQEQISRHAEEMRKQKRAHQEEEAKFVSPPTIPSLPELILLNPVGQMGSIGLQRINRICIPTFASTSSSCLNPAFHHASPSARPSWKGALKRSIRLISLTQGSSTLDRVESSSITGSREIA